MTGTYSSTRPGATFDHRGHEAAYSPYERWRRLRDEDPVAYSELYGGFHVVSRHADVCEVARMPETFSSGINTIPPLPTTFPPISYDPPDNRKYRMILNPFFAPSALEHYRAWIVEQTDAIMTPLLASDRFDFAFDLGVPLTRTVILEMMGVVNAPSELNEWSDAFIMQEGDIVQAYANLLAFLSSEIDARRREPGGDVLTGMVQGRFDDRLLTDDELVSAALLLLTAGLETTNSTMTASVLYLLDHPETCADYVARAEVRDPAMDEFVRWASPATAQARRVRHDTEFQGCPMKAGDNVLILWGSANRDEREFENPDEIILDRFPNRHVGFGMGPHRCLGSHLAKMVMRGVFDRLTPELHRWQIEDREALRWQAGEVRSLRALPLVRVAS